MPAKPSPPTLPDESSLADTRSRIVAAAAGLIASGGSDAATTRAVAAAAAVQAPTIYRLFGDKGGLLDAVAEQAMADYVAGKARQEEMHGDPVEALRQGWDAHVAFGLSHPAVFALMHAARSGPPSGAMVAGLAILRDKVRRVARDGRLRVNEEQAVDLVHAMGTGTVLTLLRKPPEHRQGLSEAAREAVLAAILGERPQTQGTGAAGIATALRACLADEVTVLTHGEQQLMGELLERIGRTG